MLTELHVRDLGVIADATLVLGPGMTALTGETGAGKTLLVDAIELLVGQRADAVLVRPGAEEARVEGRFVVDGAETVLARVVPGNGRSRAYVDGRLATAAELADLGRSLVDLHGQHDHQSLLATRVQRAALDRAGAIDLGPLAAARERVASVEEALSGLGGDTRSRAREIELLRFQVGEIEAAAIAGDDEDRRLESEEDRLADASAHREAAATALEELAADGTGAVDAVARALASLSGRRPFEDVAGRLEGLVAELSEAAADLRRAGESVVDDPGRLAEVRARRRLIRDLCRKYGDDLGEVLDFGSQASRRLADLEAHDARAAALDEERARARAAVEEAAAALAEARRAAAPGLAAAVEGHLRQLALPRARFEIDVGGPGGEAVDFRLGPNPGEPAVSLARAASGGELARAMLAVRLVLTESPPTLVFDEVDAGVGGEAALAVGRALAALAAGRQVLVVTHLPQVAAFADHQVAVSKAESGGRTVATVHSVSGAQRVVELSRMLSGQPSSATARDHAEELLDVAARERGR